MRYGKWFIGLITAAFVLVAVAFGKSEYSWDGTLEVRAKIISGENEEEIELWEKEDGEIYLFLPSYVDLSQVVFETNYYDAVYINDEQIWSDVIIADTTTLETENHLRCILGENEYCYTLTIVKSKNIPAVYIDTLSGNMEYIHDKKGNAEAGRMRIYTESGKLDYVGSFESLKGRGNTTWNYEKKPYNLTLDAEANLLGQGTAKRWILLANALDESNMKNKIAYELARDSGLDFTPECEWIDLYLNGEYAGLYLLCERNEIDEQRINISRDGSFLVGKDWEWRFEREKKVHIITEAGTALRVYYSDIPVERILSIFQTIENAILADDGIDKISGKHWSDLIDMESWVKRYLIEEILGSTDAGTLSQYFYFDGADESGKIYAGPIWDMDLSMRYSGGEWLKKMNQFYGNKPNVHGSAWPHALYHNALYYDTLTKTYEMVFFPLLEELLDSGIDKYYSHIQQSAEMNRIRWNTNEMESERENIRHYIEKRILFLNRIWIDKEDYVIVTIDDLGGKKRSLVIEPGATIPELRAYEDDDTILFYGWYYLGTDMLFDVEKPIYEDLEIEARYDIIS